MINEEGVTDGRVFVVLVEGEDRPFCISRREDGALGPRTGPWRLLTEEEAAGLAKAWNDESNEGGVARAVEVYRYDRDPAWPEDS